jgi:hypothetical protein
LYTKLSGYTSTSQLVHTTVVNKAGIACSLSTTLPLLLLFFTKIPLCALMSYSTMNHIGKVAPDPEMLTFGDEAAKDKRTLIRQHGRSRMRYVTSIYELPVAMWMMNLQPRGATTVVRICLTCTMAEIFRIGRRPWCAWLL